MKPSSLRPPQRTQTGSGLLAGGFPHQMLRLPARSSFNPPIVPGLEHGLGVVGADEGVGAVPSPARVPQFHDHILPHVHALVVYLRQTVGGDALLTEEALDPAVGAGAYAYSLTLPGPLLKLGMLGGDDGLQLIVWLLHLSHLSSVGVFSSTPSPLGQGVLLERLKHNLL